MLYKMRLFIGCCVNQQLWNLSLPLELTSFNKERRDAPVYSCSVCIEHGTCQTRSTVHKLVTFVQLVLHGYNGFNQSFVMESDFFPQDECVGELAYMPQCWKRQTASAKKKIGDCSLRETCYGIKTISLTVIDK